MRAGGINRVLVVCGTLFISIFISIFISMVSSRFSSRFCHLDFDGSSESSVHWCGFKKVFIQ